MDVLTATPTLQSLGLKPVINASATLTKLGGSLMAPEVVAAMAEGARHFTDLPELQRAVGKRIAELTRNDACYVSSGAAGGIVVSIAAAIAGTDPERIAAFPYLEGVAKKDVVIWKSQRNGYDYAVRQTGARLIEIGDELSDLKPAMTDTTAAVIYFAGNLARTSPGLPEVIDVVHAQGVPVIVDAAAQVPNVANLWYFTTELGADIAIFSGGKGLCGPQSSGLVLGRRDLIEGCKVNGSPNSSIGRPLKVGKEEMFGILAAVELALQRNEPEMIEWYESVVTDWIESWSNLPGITVERGYPNEAGQPFGRVILTFDDDAIIDRDGCVQSLWDGDPRIAVSAIGDRQIGVNPQTVQQEEVTIIARAVTKMLGA